MRLNTDFYDIVFNWLAKIEKEKIIVRNGGVGMSIETLLDILENGQNYKGLSKRLKEERNERQIINGRKR